MRRYLSSTSYSSLALSVGQIGVGAIQLALVLPFATRMPRAAAAARACWRSSRSAPSAPASPTCSCTRSSAVSGATVASTVTYFIPIVSIAIGVIGLGEQLAWNAPVGAAVIVAGALLSRTQPEPRVSAPALVADEPLPARLRG